MELRHKVEYFQRKQTQKIKLFSVKKTVLVASSKSWYYLPHIQFCYDGNSFELVPSLFAGGGDKQ